ncbi:unnamed protein product, partial [Mesorhabditis belari]|uniref:C-type lectin domain-containing protein n=1 Tax=Mesorhabditis belari TaxID=2138241 RepID=A0AAF3EKS4_9BILA
MFAINETKFYFDAIRGCASLDGIPVKIQNLYENSFIYSYMLQGELKGATPFIGVERKETNVWTYADGTPLTYQNWGPNEPNNSSSTSICAVMSSQTAQWYSVECSIARPYICSIDGDNFQCPDGWVYSNQTDYCYYLQNFTYTDGVHWQLYNQTTAETLCRRMDSHLVSIHSDVENDFVMELATSNVSGLANVAPDNDPCGSQWAWIGYYGNGTIGTGTWTDGSPVDYINYRPNLDVFLNWVIANDSRCNLPRVWIRTYGYNAWPRAVCKKPSKNRIAKTRKSATGAANGCWI